MRPERAVISNDIVRYCVSCIAEVYVTRHRYPLILQAPEEAFHWAIIPAVSTPAHTLLDPISPQQLPILPARIMTALIAVDHHSGWLAARFPCHFQRFHGESAVW